MDAAVQTLSTPAPAPTRRRRGLAPLEPVSARARWLLGLAFFVVFVATWAVFTLGGYVSSTDASAEQPASAHTAIALGFTVVPAVLVLASMVVLRSYRLDEEVHR